MKILIFMAIVMLSSFVFFISKCLIEWLMYNNEQLDKRRVSFLSFIYGRLEDFTRMLAGKLSADRRKSQ